MPRKDYCDRNKELLKEKARLYYLANKEKLKAQTKKYKEANRESVAAGLAAWGKNNPSKVRALWAKRDAAKLQATPDWADEFIVSEIYDLATRRTKAAGVQWHVDHIVPLRSRLVCGLHCEFNMRVITGTTNMTKGNRHWPDMPE